MSGREREPIPIWRKLNLTIDEACQYANIGEHTLRSIFRSEKGRNLLIHVGNRTLVKRKQLEEYNEQLKSL